MLLSSSCNRLVKSLNTLILEVLRWLLALARSIRLSVLVEDLRRPKVLVVLTLTRGHKRRRSRGLSWHEVLLRGHT